MSSQRYSTSTRNMVRQAAFAEVDDNLASVAFDFAVLVPKLNIKVFHKSLNVAVTGPCRAGSPDPVPFYRGGGRARTTVFYRIRAWRGTGPRPTVTRGVFFTVARGPVPRERCENCRIHRSAGACPPRTLRGEGNPLACACGRRGPKPYGKTWGPIL